MVAKGVSRDLFYLYGIVSNPLRRQIVEMLGDEGPSGFTQIRKRLNVPVGTLYYHFDMLSALITQDNQKRCVLTEAGRDAYQKLRSTEYVRSGELLSNSTGSQLTAVEKGLRMLVPASLLASLQRKSTFSVFMAATILALGSLSAYLAGLETIVLFVNPSDQTYLLPVEFLLNWLIVFGVADFLATYLFSRKGEHLTLLAASAYALLPLLVFEGWWEVAVALSLKLLGLSTFGLSRVILVLLQAWSLAMLARIVSVIKGLRLDKAAIITLVLAYLSITIALLRGV